MMRSWLISIASFAALIFSPTTLTHNNHSNATSSALSVEPSTPLVVYSLLINVADDEAKVQRVRRDFRTESPAPFPAPAVTFMPNIAVCR